MSPSLTERKQDRSTASNVTGARAAIILRVMKANAYPPSQAVLTPAESACLENMRTRPAENTRSTTVRTPIRSSGATVPLPIALLVRVTLEGRETLLADFQPAFFRIQNPGLKPRTEHFRTFSPAGLAPGSAFGRHSGKALPFIESFGGSNELEYFHLRFQQAILIGNRKRLRRGWCDKTFIQREGTRGRFFADDITL